MNVRQLAAVDMHGARGSVLRRRVILTEFVLGAIGGAAFGVWALTSWDGALGVLFGLYLLGLGANYLVLAAEVITLWPDGALDAELTDIDIRAALRHYTVTQVWVFVSFLFPALELAQRRGE